MSSDDDFDALIDKTVGVYRADPRNKVYASSNLLVAAVEEELGVTASTNSIAEVVDRYKEGNIQGEDQDIYDAMTFGCSVLARKCFGVDPDDEDEEVDYELSWLEADDGEVVAEIRPL